MNPSRKLAIVVSHPIQHFVPLYRALAASDDIQPRVFYASRIGLERYFDPEMNTEIAWNMDMLSGYDHVFLPGAEAIKEVTFGSINSPGLAGALDDFAPDAVMVYGYMQRNAHRAMGWARRRGKPVLMISDSEMLAERSGLKRLAKEAVVRAIYRRVDAFLSVGDNNEAYYRRYGAPADRIFRSPFTIDERAFVAAAAARDEHRSALRAQLGIAGDALIALVVGKLSERKRPGDVLEAVARLKEKGGPVVHAVFAGNGALLDPLKEEALRRAAPAHFPGFVNVDKLPAFYAAADMLAHASQADPHPLVCSEAACTGLPVILSDRIGAAGPTDIARAGVNALIFPVGDVDALAAQIALLANDPARRAAMAQAALDVFADQDVRRSIDGIRRGMAAGRRR